MNPMAARLSQLYKGTAAELSLEDAVAEIGVPYRFQFPGYLYGLRYFPDFVLPTLKLVIEVDDKSHKRPDKVEADRQRTLDIFEKWGYRVVRCTNENALSDPRGTVRAMLSSAGLWPLPSHRPPIAVSLPVLAKAAQKQRREAKSAATRARRGLSS